MQTENTQPLYKVLNEKRTKGIWQVGRRCSIISDHDLYVGDMMVNKSEIAASKDGSNEDKANAQYTALAVNNLHILAEALKRLTDKWEGLANGWDWWDDDDTDTLKEAQAALKRIS